MRYVLLVLVLLLVGCGPDLSEGQPITADVTPIPGTCDVLIEPRFSTASTIVATRKDCK